LVLLSNFFSNPYNSSSDKIIFLEVFLDDFISSCSKFIFLDFLTTLGFSSCSDSDYGSSLSDNYSLVS